MDTLCNLYEEHHIYDVNIIPFKNNLIESLIKCIKQEKDPESDFEILFLMKYHKKFDKQQIFNIMIKNELPCSLLIFSLLCGKEDKELYRNAFDNHILVKNNPNIINYAKVKLIIQDNLQTKTKNKNQLSYAKKLLDNIDNNFLKSVPYYKYFVKYFLGDYDKAFDYLMIFFKSIKYFNPEHIDIYYDKFNIIKFYNELNKLDNKEIFKPLFDKLNNDKTIKFIHLKMNKFKDKKSPCSTCKANSISFDFFNCNHLYCIDCITEKNCSFCKTKHIY